MTASSANHIAETAPPMAHAIGGSLGSAIALLLLYPLERARVELQTLTASSSSSSSSSSSTTKHAKHPQDINNKVQPIPKSSRGGGTTFSAATRLPRQVNNPEERGASTTSDDESWVTCPSDADCLSPSSTNPSSIDQYQAAMTTAFKSKSADNHHTSSTKLGLVSCIYQLHQKGQLYNGVTPVVITMAASNFVFFYMHSFLKQLLLLPNQSTSRKSKTLYLSLMASSLAGIINVLLTNPLWVANLRIVTSSSSKDSRQHNNNIHHHHHHYNTNNLWRELVHIVQTEGWAHLWQGTTASLLLVSNPVIQFVAYEQLKTRWLHHLKPRHYHQSGATTTALAVALKPVEAFLLGALAKAISTILTYPLQLAQTVLRVQKQEETQEQKQQIVKPSSTTVPKHQSLHPSAASLQTTPRPTTPSTTPTYKGTLDCLIQIYQRRGLEGWFTGMRTKLLQTVLTAAFTFLTYEQILSVLMTVHRALLARRKRLAS